MSLLSSRSLTPHKGISSPYFWPKGLPLRSLDNSCLHHNAGLTRNTVERVAQSSTWSRTGNASPLKVFEPQHSLFSIAIIDERICRNINAIARDKIQRPLHSVIKSPQSPTAAFHSASSPTTIASSSGQNSSIAVQEEVLAGEYMSERWPSIAVVQDKEGLHELIHLNSLRPHLLSFLLRNLFPIHASSTAICLHLIFHL